LCFENRQKYKILRVEQLIMIRDQWRNKGEQPEYWPRAQTKKLKKSHTKGRKKIFLKGRYFLRGRKNPDLAPGDKHPCYATVRDRSAFAKTYQIRTRYILVHEPVSESGAIFSSVSNLTMPKNFK